MLKRSDLGYDDNFEVNIYSVTAFCKLQNDFLFIKIDQHTQSGVINGILRNLLFS